MSCKTCGAVELSGKYAMTPVDIGSIGIANNTDAENGVGVFHSDDAAFNNDTSAMRSIFRWCNSNVGY